MASTRGVNGVTTGTRYARAAVTYEATDQTALDMIAVHGRDAVDVAMECVRALLRRTEPDAVSSWLGIVEAIRTRLRLARQAARRGEMQRAPVLTSKGPRSPRVC